MRGEFIRGDGLIVPNNITTYGADSIFRAALLDAGYDFYIGLANCNPDPLLDANALNEPTSGVYGYSRQAIPRDSTGWTVTSTLNGETYFESKNFVFEAGGGAFDKPINRLAIINGLATSGVIVVALSSPLPSPILITPDVDVSLRTFKYRIYGR